MTAGRRPRRPAVLLRQVPGDSVIHRLWAGTKIVSVLAYGVVLSVVPSWPGIIIGAALLLASARLAGIPRRAVPLPPRWFAVAIGLGAAFTLSSGGRPEVAVGSGHIGLGHLELYFRFACLSVVLLLASAMISWTTSLGDVAPALARLGGPLRRLRIPVDEWAVTVALCIRSLPLLVDELRIVVAARRLRRPPDQGRSVNASLDEAIDVFTATLVSSMRRAGEMAEAITARGGIGQLSAETGGPGRADAVAAGVVALACVGVVALSGL